MHPTMASMEDAEMMDVDADTSTGHGHGLNMSGPDEGSAYRPDPEGSTYRSDAGSSSYAHHPATQGYNEYSVGQEAMQQQRNQRQGRRLSQQRARSMGHAPVEPENGGSGNSSRSGSMAHPNPQQRSRSGSPPPIRRGSMTENEQQERRQQIKAILADRSIPDVERRKSIQALMDGRRSSIGSQASYGSGYGSYAGGVSRASSHHSLASSGSLHADGQHGGTPTSVLQAHIATGGVHHPHQVYPAPEGAGAPAHGFHPDDRTVHSASAVLMGYKPKSHPYNSSTTPVPAVAAQDQAFYQHQQSATEHSKRAELSRPACEHYNRNCTIISPCCGAAFGCRICHDDCPVLPPVIQQCERVPEEPMGMSSGLGVMDHEGTMAGGGGGDGGGGAGGGAGRQYPRSASMPVSLASFQEPQHHTIDRHAIREVICRRCYTRQSSKTNNCISCGVQFGEYHCAICNLWMTAEERPYHCAECGFCRVGGAENFRHCNDCGMCIDASLFAQHNCKVGKYMQNCPICQEDLFSSRSASHEMPCGHAIHWHCFRELAAHDSRCPVCKKTAETHERMQPTWNAMAMGIELQPVPPDLAKAVTIICNDCERTEDNRAWHFLGVQCRSCTSFNTVVERITKVGAEAHAFLATADPHPSQRQAAREAAAAQQQQEQRQQRHRQRLQPPAQQPAAMVTDGEVPAEEQERLFREQQEYQARYMQMRRAEQQQLEQMRSEQQQQQQQQQQQEEERGGALSGSRRRIRDVFNGRRRSMGL